MPAPTGNQYALGNGGGRPRSWDREQISQEFLEWAKLPDSTCLAGFCEYKLLPPQKLSEWASQSEEFREIYWLVKSILHRRREQLVSTENLAQVAYRLSNHTYDYFVREEDRDYFKYQKELEAKVGKEIAQVANADIAEKLERMHNQISQLQSSARNKADNSIKSNT